MTVTVMWCRTCGWISCNFKKGQRIDHAALAKAREAYRKHVKDVHGGSAEAETQVEVIRLSKTRAKEIRKVRK